jgi:hypothetical protein
MNRPNARVIAVDVGVVEADKLAVDVAVCETVVDALDE